MKFNINNAAKLNGATLEEDLSFTDEQIHGINSLLNIENAHAIATINDYGDIVRVHLCVKADLTLECAYTLEALPFPVDVEEDLDFSTEDTGDENVFYAETSEVSLDEYIFGLIVTEIPMKVVKKGASLPEAGKGYEVISEDEYNERKENRVDPRLSALDDFDLKN